MMTACGESLEQRAAREAKDYTERCCPTPVVNYSRTDSVSFDINTRTYTYYCSFVDVLDDKKWVQEHKKELQEGIHDIVYNNAGLKAYVEKGIKFHYIIRSDKDPKTVLFEETL